MDSFPSCLEKELFKVKRREICFIHKVKGTFLTESKFIFFLFPFKTSTFLLKHKFLTKHLEQHTNHLDGPSLP